MRKGLHGLRFAALGALACAGLVFQTGWAAVGIIAGVLLIVATFNS